MCPHVHMPNQVKRALIEIASMLPGSFTCKDE